MTDKPDQPGTEPPSVTWEPAAAEAAVTGVQPDEVPRDAPQQTVAFGQEPPGSEARQPASGHPHAGPAGPGTPPPPVHPTPVPPAPRRPPHMTRTWIAAVVAAVLLLGGGVGGYAIGAAGGHRDHGPGWSEQRGGPDGGMRGNGDGPWNR